jgi:hypothetical protein
VCTCVTVCVSVFVYVAQVFPPGRMATRGDMGGSYSQTRPEKHPWWEVDLGAVRTICCLFTVFCLRVCWLLTVLLASCCCGDVCVGFPNPYRTCL